MPQTIMSGDWYDSEAAANKLGVTVRTLQKWAQRGHLEFKTVNEDRRRTRLYSAESIDRFQQSGPREERKPAAPETMAIEPRTPKPSQTERALDMVSIVGNLAVGHKGELEILVKQAAQNLDTLVLQMSKNLESVVSLVLNHQKQEADANRERIKAEREDNRERWELDRQDRLARRKLTSDNSRSAHRVSAAVPVRPRAAAASGSTLQPGRSGSRKSRRPV